MLFIAVCLITAQPQSGEAGETSDNKTVYRVPDVVVTATRNAKSFDEVTADVEVLRIEDIQAAPTTNFDDMLRRLSGVEVGRPSDMAVTYPHHTAIRGVKGPNKVLYMIDGMPLNSALTGFVIPGIIQTENIERIEVVKGAFSALYGSNAMGGAINVITKKRTAEGAEFISSAAGGSDGFREAAARAEARKSGLAASLTAGYRTIHNHYRTDRRNTFSYSPITGAFTREESEAEHASFRSGRASFRIDYDVSDTTAVALSGGYVESYTGMGTTTHLPRERGRDINRTLYYLNMSGRTPAFGDFELETMLYTNYDRTKMDDENMVGHEGLLRTRYSYEYGDRYYWGRDTGLQLKAAGPVGEAGFLTTGIDLHYKQGYWKNRGSGGTVIDKAMDKNMTTHALYLQYELTIFNCLTISMGGRFDDNSESESSISPKLGMLWNVTDRIILRSSVGRAFRAPNLSELYQPTWQMIPGIPFMSNPNLDPEVIWSYDIGATVRLFSNTTLELTAFYTDAEDLINPIIRRGIMKYENVNKVETDGFEVSIRTAPLSWLNAYVNYTYTHAVDRDTGRLDDSPLHRINAGVRTVCSLSPQARLTTSLDVRYTDSMFFQDRMTKNLLKLDDYIVADMTMQLCLFDRFTIKSVVTNLFDEEYDQHNADAGPERAWWVKVSYRF